MKNLIFSLFLLSSLLFITSCEKEVPPTNPANNNAASTTRDITVDYSVYAVSQNVEIVAKIMVDGDLVEKTFTVNRLSHTIHFECKSGQLLSLKARNVNPSHDEVMVSIYVDGFLFKSNSTTETNAWASVAGTPN